MEGAVIAATRSDYETFKESLIWHDIVTELTMWKEGFAREMQGLVPEAKKTNPSTASVLMHLGDLNGRLETVDYVLGIPDLFISILEPEEKEEVSDEYEE